MKILIGFCLLLLATAQSFARTDVYGLHLFFNEKEFVDVLTLEYHEGVDVIKGGHMDVPNDFDGPIINPVAFSGQLRFDLFVPKNSSRPKDLVFDYRAFFFDETRNQMYGYVTLKGSDEFVASFVAFKREG